MNKQRIVVVTGGSKGIGSAISNAFIRKGDIVWSITRTLPEADQKCSGLRYLSADVRDRSSMDLAVDEIKQKSGTIDVWINNAGFGKPVGFHDEDNALWEAIFDVNFWGTVHGTRAALSALTRPGGNIINIASTAGMMAPDRHSAYSVSKAAIIALTRANAVEFSKTGIRVNAIAPGPVDTEGFRAAGGDPQQRAQSIPIRKMVQPEEVAEACVFLAESSASLTGHTLAIDGALSAAGCYV